MSKHDDLIKKFYSAMQKLDFRTMGECYHKDATFSDPVFTELSGKEVPAMWEMLLSRAKDFKVEFSGVHSEGDEGRANWVANYTFSKTGRPVCNRVSSEFTFQDGKIIEQKDTFDFAAWQGQALGLPGKLLGWTGLLNGKIRGQSDKMLQDFLDKQ